jgi:hypothetical protein
MNNVQEEFSIGALAVVLGQGAEVARAGEVSE